MFSTHSTSRNAEGALKGAADSVLNGIANGAQSLRRPRLDRLLTQAEALGRRGLDAVRDRSHGVRDRAADVSERTASYVKDEPLKSMLFAAAAGAAVAIIVSLLSSTSRRD